MYSIRLLNAASHELERLDKPIAQRVVRRLRWLAENADHVSHEPLKGSFSGLCKLRQGDYRIGYELIKDRASGAGTLHRTSPRDLQEEGLTAQ